MWELKACVLGENLRVTGLPAHAEKTNQEPPITKPKGFPGSKNTACNKLSLLTVKQLAAESLLRVLSAATFPPHLSLQLSSLSMPFPYPFLFSRLAYTKIKK